MARLASCEAHPIYKAGCEDCARAYKRYKVIHHRPERPAAMVTQMLRELRAAGYPLPVLAAETGLAPGSVMRLSLGCSPTVQLGTWQAVQRTYRRLRMFPGPNPRAALWASKHGWTAPQPEPLPADFYDEIAVERALAGESVGLSKADRLEVVRRMRAKGATSTAIAKHLHLNGVTAATLVAAVDKAVDRAVDDAVDKTRAS